jgi:hypothetical protein
VRLASTGYTANPALLTKCGCSISEAPPLTAEICGSGGASLLVSASWPPQDRLLWVVKVAHVVTAGELLDGHSVLDLECLDRVYLNAYVPILQSSGQVWSRL